MTSFAAKARQPTTTPTPLLGRRWISGSDMVFGDAHRFSGEELNSIMETFAEEFPAQLSDAIKGEIKFQHGNTALNEVDRDKLLQELETLSGFLNTPMRGRSLEEVARAAIKKQFFGPNDERPIPETPRDAVEWIHRTTDYLCSAEAYEAEPSLKGLSAHMESLSSLLHRIGYDFRERIEKEAKQISGRVV